MITSIYLRSALVPEIRKRTIETVANKIRKSGLTFDAVVIRGFSGALIGIPIADLFEKPIIICRKQRSEYSHGMPVEGVWFGSDLLNYIIIDDFIFSGETIREIERAMGSAHTAVNLVGIFLYKPESSFKSGLERSWESKIHYCYWGEAEEEVG